MSAGRPSLTLLVPGLFGPVPELAALPAAELPPLPALRLLLSRGRPGPAVSEDLETTLFQLFDVRAAGDLPVAALTRVLDGAMPDDAWWLRADPVFMQADVDRMVLSEAEGLALSVEEARSLAAEVEAAFAEEGWHLEVGAPHRWYLRPGGEPRLRTSPLRAARGRDVGPLLPRGADGRRWVTHLNEVQMVLHASPVNADREARGLRPVNSLWFWGGGRFPQFGRCRWQGVWASDALARALAMQCGVATREAPAGFAQWLADEPGPGEHLVVIEDPEAPLRAHDVFGWLSALRKLEQDWLAPLVRAVRGGTVRQLRLIDTRAVDADRAALWRIWRPRRRLPALVAERA